jgi:hypothetical protein
MQHARVGVLLPVGAQQNMRTGIVPLTSVRYAIASKAPAQGSSAWINPCYSAEGTGMWDSEDTRNTFYESSSQSCAAQADLCKNPESAFLVSSYLEFFLPLGEDTITSSMLNGGFSIFVSLDVSIVDASGIPATTTLMVQGALTELSIAKACESLEAAANMMQATDIEIAIGIAGTPSDWDAHVTRFGATSRSFVQVPEASSSLASGLVTIVATGDPAIFSKPAAGAYSIELDALVTMHFLDPVRYAQVAGMVQNYQMVEGSTGRMSIRLDQVWTFPRVALLVGILCSILQALIYCILSSLYGMRAHAAGSRAASARTLSRAGSIPRPRCTG